jgi:hypothetical protein
MMIVFGNMKWDGCLPTSPHVLFYHWSYIGWAYVPNLLTLDLRNILPNLLTSDLRSNILPILLTLDVRNNILPNLLTLDVRNNILPNLSTLV